MLNKIKKPKKIYSTYDLEQIKIKKLMFELKGISNYLMQDYENDSELTDFQQLWKALTETIDFLEKYMALKHNFKWNELRYTDRELEIMKELKEGLNDKR